MSIIWLECWQLRVSLKHFPYIFLISHLMNPVFPRYNPDLFLSSTSIAAMAQLPDCSLSNKPIQISIQKQVAWVCRGLSFFWWRSRGMRFSEAVVSSVLEARVVAVDSSVRLVEGENKTFSPSGWCWAFILESWSWAYFSNPSNDSVN